MKTIYIDKDFKCHTSNDGTMTAVETDFFDGMCETMIEGYRFVPEGETWTREDGTVFHGEMIAPLRRYSELTAAQGEFVKAEGTIVTLATAGAAQVKARCTETNSAPDADTGIFARGADAWEPGKAYSQHDLFSYNGALGYVKQVHTSQETWLPFTAGTEALYGARPAPDEDGVYPYVYNMAASVGMKVREGDTVYECIQAIPDMLYPPSMLVAHFVLA